MKDRRPPRKTGFTLVELLVVIAIIAILAAILLPALALSKAQARSAVCKNHLHEMAIAMRLYTDDSGVYPCFFMQAAGAYTAEEQGKGFVHWVQEIAPYYKLDWTNPAYHCPAYSGAILAPGLIDANTESTIGNLYGSYSYNLYGTSAPGTQDNPSYELGVGVSPFFYNNGQAKVSARADSQVIAPAETYMLMDVALTQTVANVKELGFSTGLYWLGSGWSGWDDAGCYYGAFPALSPVQHGKNLNVGFCDGHVAPLRVSELFFNPLSNRVPSRNWNYDFQPHPESWQ
jgi:prepilin-type N-terminal cleavage/methylation domain-containing protein/prepilin-type processing-associated H-X9-DG protein